MSVEVEHAGMGAAWLRSHPGTPIAHVMGDPCAYCDRAENEAPGSEALRKAAQALLETWDLVYCVEYIRDIDDATLAETGDLLDDRIDALRAALGAREDTGTVSVTPDGHLLYSADPAEGGPA